MDNKTEVKTLKEEYLENFIPSLQRMFDKEVEHIASLKKYDPRIFPMVTKFIEHAEGFKNRLETIIAEYKEHADKL